MSNLLPRHDASLMSTSVPAGFSRTESKELARFQNREVAAGLVAATRVQAAGFVAGVALNATAMLSREAAVQADGDPVIANRLNHLVDMFAVFCGSEVSQMGRRP